MKRHFLLLGVVVAAVGMPTARGQSIYPSTLNAAGGSAVIAGNTYEWSAGEMTMVNTFTTPTIVITQGLLQPVIGVPTSVINNNLSTKLQVFPNPASSIINIEYSSLYSGTISLRLMDITGRLVMEQKSDIKQGANTKQLDIAPLAVATYIMKVAVSNADGTEETTSYKIQKIQ